METPNIFKEDTDLNIVKSWLCNATDGQTYSLGDRFLTRLTDRRWDFNIDRVEGLWDEVIGYKHDYKVDDPEMEKEAEAMLKRIYDFIDELNKNADKYFPEDGFCNSDGYSYVCVRETPDDRNEIVQVCDSPHDAKKWVDEEFDKFLVNNPAVAKPRNEYHLTQTPNEYSVWDSCEPYGLYAKRIKKISSNH